MYKTLLLLTLFSVNFCKDCIFHVVNKVEHKQEITHTVDLDPGQAYKASLKMIKGKAKLDIDEVTDKKCVRNTCTFTGMSGMQKIIVTGNPGPSIYDLKIYNIIQNKAQTSPN